MYSDSISVSGKAARQFLGLKLESLGLTKEMLASPSVFDSIDVKTAILFSPNTQSNFALSLSAFPNYKVEESIKNIMEKSGVSYFEFYSSFETKGEETKKTDLLPWVNSHLNEGTLLAVKNVKGILPSLYWGLRNSIAHGDVLFRDNIYYFFSEDRNHKLLNFFLATKDPQTVNRLLACIETVIKPGLESKKQQNKKTR